MFSRLTLLTIAITAAACSRGGPPPEPRKADGTIALTRGPYLQLATQDSIRIVWRTREAIQPVLKWGKSADALTETLPDSAISLRQTKSDNESGANPLHSAPEGTRQYEAVISGLSPDTLYHYSLSNGAELMSPADGSCAFRTLPVPGADRPFRFWVVGDSGTATTSQKAVHLAFQKWSAAPGRETDFFVHVGDMAYNKGLDSEFQYGFFGIYEETLRRLVTWPAMGNHEGWSSKGDKGTGPYFDAYICPANAEAGGMASGTEGFYSWDYGRTHFIALNSHDVSRKADGLMARWLKDDLERARADWIIAYWHHPPYTKGSHDSDKEKDLKEMREWIMPIIESGGVDLVLTGHSHIYERSMLLDGAYDTPTTAENHVLDDKDGNPAGEGPYHKRPGAQPNDGTLQIVAGHGGQALSRGKKPSPVMRRSIVEWGSVIVEVKGNTLTGIMLNADGEERDRWQIVKDATAASPHIAAPRPPDAFVGPEKLKTYTPKTPAAPAAP